MWRAFCVFVAAVLVGLVAVDLYREDQAGGDGSVAESSRRLLSADTALRKADTAKAEFTVEFAQLAYGRMTENSKVTWQGVTTARFGPAAASDTVYSSIVVGQDPATSGRRVRIGESTFFSSPGVTPNDRKPWVDESKTEVN